MSYILRSLLLSSDSADFPTHLPEMPDSWKNCQKDLDKNLKFKGDIHFIIGPWGSGKSTFVSTYLKITNVVKRPHRVSLNTATTSDEVFSHLVRDGLKIFYILFTLSLCGLSLWLYQWDGLTEALLKKYPAIGFFVGTFVFLFITNRFRIFYLISSYLELLLGKQTKIIEDFDRGGLQNAEIYNSLIFRNKAKTSYLVILGYKNQHDRDDYIDMGLKLNANITIFDTDNRMVHSIFSKLYKTDFSIAPGDWIGTFTARKIISIFTHIDHISQERGTTSAHKLLWSVFFKELCKELSITDPPKLSFTTHGRSIDSTFITTHQRNILNSFLSCIDQGLFQQFAHETGGAGNQGQVFAYNLFINNTHGAGEIGSTSRL